jgi:hypothetical protein
LVLDNVPDDHLDATIAIQLRQTAGLSPIRSTVAAATLAEAGWFSSWEIVAKVLITDRE